mmetsp:Transcript_32613/g.53215  ORF Transcript_32613/g.53215 Transcript_32613/m.53215 type:complete len:244 (-) Transcript_32613:1548-2279(-)|eukprot:CAMPEP_0201867164 /NCGR_PEP_ID=MMETSP0902-20130614/1504_1 /ASSEMBLY_ACC=CAM_ASM_000551 /TAXON_ID=420261 /ORGANISM="Thalassiosira antarctica, Strain CCMP982" /LENGTH=243 /DNA_ID=CAMNT_0048392283 /DNA_START=173 /DNA_END=904 /DNA_ORIENTATION=-
MGEGTFRTAYAGTYIGGNRNNQEAICKCFKGQYRGLESDFFQSDFNVADRAIQYAEDWNDICASDETILITRGDVHTIGRTKYLVEPLIRNFTKFTSNNGWISDEEGWRGEAMEAFTHYTYHRSGGNLIVCDLQGRYKYNRFNKSKSRFELTDIAVCSRRCTYGPTDLGEKGIDSFFNSHVCNQFCGVDGHWQRPKRTRQWFPQSSSTSMMRSSQAHLLNLNNRSTFTPGYAGILEEDSDCDY